ncbi:MAG: amino acid ABC transporter ATP-binding protein, partial [Firmicutes bacterium]|nr:amino acid ABC transporter ATP-binding protein [Bacillota bacterium]
MIEVVDLHKYFGDLQVLRGITESIKDGEVVCVVGPSGSGKSTFLRCLNLLEEPTSGKIILDGQQINEKGVDLNQVRQKLGMVFQNFNL